MNGSTTGRAVVVGLLFLIVGAGIAMVAYNAGTQHALTDGGRAFTAPPNAQVVYVRPWGFGFGFFFPILFLFLIFGVMRRVLWYGGGRGGWYHHRGYCGPQRDDAPGPDVTGTTV